jgi:hypothetical protein
MLGVAGDGHRFPPYVIFRGEPDGRIDRRELTIVNPRHVGGSLANDNDNNYALSNTSWVFFAIQKKQNQQGQQKTKLTTTMEDGNNQPMLLQTFEIVGLHGKSNCRCCVQHEGCGKILRDGDVCRVVRTQVRINDTVEDALKIVKIADGTERCVVGFAPKAYLKSK